MNLNFSIKDKALFFACLAHLGQVRKTEKNKPMIVHPIETGRILERYGFDDNTVAAGFLHDVIEDTKYTKEDILELFGEDICSLVVAASESDKSLSWEERKLETIRKVRGFDDRKKAVVCADKISNLSCLKSLFDRTGNRDFSSFKVGESLQSWYYTVLHRSIIYGKEEEKNEMYLEMKNLVDDIFYGRISKEQLEANYYIEDKERLDKLIKLDALASELYKLRKLVILENKPTVIEFLGTMRAGKTSAIKSISELLKKKGFKVKIIDEFTTSIEFKEEIKNNFKGTLQELHQLIFEKVNEKIDEAKEDLNADFVIIDRGLNDRLIWLNRLYLSESKITREEYDDLLSKWHEKAINSADIIFAFKVSSETSMKRDYLSSMSLENRHFMSLENINQYNMAMTIAIFELFKPKLKFVSVNTENQNMIDTNISCATDLLNILIEDEISRIKEKTTQMANEYFTIFEKE